METCSCKQFQQDAASLPKKIAKTPQPQSENLSACCSMIFLDQRKLKTMVLILLRSKSALTSQRKSSNVWWTHWHGGRSMLISFPAWEIWPRNISPFVRPAERFFSVAGQVVDKRRCKLGNSMIDALIFFCTVTATCWV